jgi:hypothetical protein
MRRSVWEQVGGYSAELRWNEDWDFWIGAVHLGVSFGRVARPLYFYRRHANSGTAALPGMTEWMTREVILKKRAAFFAVGAVRQELNGFVSQKDVFGRARSSE